MSTNWLCQGVTRSRRNSTRFGQPRYVVTNENDDHAAPDREDYSVAMDGTTPPAVGFENTEQVATCSEGETGTPEVEPAGNWGAATQAAADALARAAAEGRLVCVPDSGPGPSGFTVNDQILHVLELVDGSFLLLGVFSEVNGISTPGGIAHITPLFAVDTDFVNPLGFAAEEVDYAAVLGNGKVLLVGRVAGQGFAVQLTTALVVDPGFTEFDNTDVDNINGLIVDDAGKAIVSVRQEEGAGPHIPGVIRLNDDGSFDDTFAYSYTAEGGAIFALADGFVETVALPGLRKFDFDGNLQATWGPSDEGWLWTSLMSFPTVTSLLDGTFIVTSEQNMTLYAGPLNTNGAVVGRAGKIENDGDISASQPAAFTGGTGPFVFSSARLAGGQVVLVGEFTGIGANAQAYALALNADMSFHSAFDPVITANLDVFRKVFVDSENRVWLLNGFTFTVNGTPKEYVAILEADGDLAI